VPQYQLVDLGRVDVRRPLGSGGVGVVYEAVDRDTGATVAIKTLHDVTPEGLYRLKREFRLLQGLEHRNVCQHYELFEHDGRWFISMECVRGEQLLHAVRDEMGDYDEDRLRDALAQLAEALCAMHDAGLVHRDLKPSNVLVEPTGRVVLISFHTQHWFELEARVEIAMYDRTIERDRPEIDALFAGLERSVLLRITSIQALSLSLRGRLALCEGYVKSARRAAARLAKVDNLRARVFGAMLEGGIAAHTRDASAIAKFREATQLAEVHDLRLHAAASRYQLGRLLGGTEGGKHIEEAAHVMTAETVVNPERFAEWFAPGVP
jgi:tRNA A-37 threonylcarbamoyl transferase component Bud32